MAKAIPMASSGALYVLAASAVFSFSQPTAHAIDATAYPSRPVRFIIPFPPSGGTDIVGRLLAERLSEKLGQPFVIDNRPGAASTIGAAIAARAMPDGYTLLLVTASYAISANYYKKLPYDSAGDFSGVSHVASGPLLFVVHPSLAASSVRDLIAIAKAAPGKLNYASGGTGGINHLAGELFNSLAKVKLVHVPYKGAGPALAGVIGGEVQVMIATVGSSLPHVRSGKLKALALAGERRSSVAAHVPTASESGLPGYSADNWYGLLTPHGTPPPVIELLSRQTVAVLTTDEVRTQLTKLGFEATGSTPQHMDSHLTQEIAKWAKVIHEAAIGQP